MTDELTQVREDMAMLAFAADLVLINAAMYSHDDKMKLFGCLSELTGRTAEEMAEVYRESTAKETSHDLD